MADKEYRLSEADVQILRGLVRADRQASGNTRNRAGVAAGDEQDQMAPEVYVVRTPSGGIPALDEVDTGTLYDDLPGSAECDAYSLDRVAGTLYRVANLTLTVWNLNTVAVPADRWVLAAREKGGAWIAVAPPDSEDHPPTTGTGTAGTGTGTGTAAATTICISVPTTVDCVDGFPVLGGFVDYVVTGRLADPGECDAGTATATATAGGGTGTAVP